MKIQTGSIILRDRVKPISISCYQELYLYSLQSDKFNLTVNNCQISSDKNINNFLLVYRMNPIFNVHF